MRYSRIGWHGGLACVALLAAGCGESPAVDGGGDLRRADGSGSDGAAGDDVDLGGLACGNGVVDPGEQCDHGAAQNTHGSGCEPDCTFTCSVDAQGMSRCDDSDPCNGVETCTADHTCLPGTGLADGQGCGTDGTTPKICKGMVCVDATCGDGLVTAPEECDDGNQVDGDGCNNDCRLSCVAMDPMRDCAPQDPCSGAATCDDASHTCSAGMPPPDGAMCGMMPPKFCQRGVCTQPTCGNAIVEPGEQCDDGNQVSGDGCEPGCTFTCGTPKTDCKVAAPACSLWGCDGNHLCAAMADPAQNGKTCGNGLTCNAGVCAPGGGGCGNGKVDPGEDCDFGMANGPGSGCEKTCKFSCSPPAMGMADKCSDGNPCNGVEKCGAVTVNGQTGNKCAPGSPPVAGTACGVGLICLGGACAKSACGDGFVDLNAGEQCDNGKANGPGTGCEITCKFSCANALADCKGAPPACNLWTCDPRHICVAAADVGKNGSACGVNLICRAGACVSPNGLCGNAIVEVGEDCDFGALNGPGSGCEKNCKFSCTLMPDPCSDGNPCNGVEKCGAVMVMGRAGQKCAAGVPLANGAGCGNAQICVAGTCSASRCGDGFVDLSIGEQCDFGMANGPNAGCEVNCKLSCVLGGAGCSDGNACNGVETCGAVVVGGQSGAKCSAGTPQADGASCGVGQICLAQACKPSVCGDGWLDKGAGEQCDFGAGNGPATGCEKTCKFSCTVMPNSCLDMNPCNGAETCGTVMVGKAIGEKCYAGTALADGTACGTGNICLSSTCKASVCGDGFVDKARGETCDPPNGSTCDAACHLIVCGDGVRAGLEQCDDGNTANLDGCDQKCRFEQDQRVNWLKMQWATAVTCAQNALGGAIVSGLAQNNLQTSLDGAIQTGSTSICFAFLGLDDLSGTADPQLSLGVLNGTPQQPMGAPAYDGTADLDWWYTSDPGALDMSRVPTTQLAGAIAAHNLTAGPGTVVVSLVLGGAPAPLKMTNAKVAVTLGATSTPKASAGALPPGHLAGEHLDPALTSFAAGGQPNANGAGQLCGNTSAASLSKVPLPMSVVQLCAGYTVNNSILDLLVGGCTFIFQQVRPTQPDQVDGSAPAAGAGAPYTLAATVGKAVNQCKDKGGAIVDLNTCLGAAAYSSFFKFTTDRVILK